MSSNLKLRDFVPQFLKDYIKLLRLRRAYPDCIINSSLVAGNITIGSHCALSNNVYVASNVTIGNYSQINPGTMIGSGEIGKFCSIAPGCLIGMPEHPVNYISTSPHTYDQGNLFDITTCWESITSPPRIGNDVWIGGNAVIMQGVTVSDGAIIAAGAVVTKDVPPYAVVGGVPAKIIRYRFSDEAISYLLDWRWWDLSELELKKYKTLFSKGDQWTAFYNQDQVVGRVRNA